MSVEMLLLQPLNRTQLMDDTNALSRHFEERVVHRVRTMILLQSKVCISQGRHSIDFLVDRVVEEIHLIQGIESIHCARMFVSPFEIRVFCFLF